MANSSACQTCCARFWIKIFYTIIICILFFIPLFICFDVFDTSKHFINSGVNETTMVCIPTGVTGKIRTVVKISLKDVELMTDCVGLNGLDVTGKMIKGENGAKVYNTVTKTTDTIHYVGTELLKDTMLGLDYKLAAGFGFAGLGIAAIIIVCVWFCCIGCCKCCSCK